MKFDFLIFRPAPSQYQVDLYDELHRQQRYSFKVIYLGESTKGRNWKDKLILNHKHEFLPQAFNYKDIYFNKGIKKVIQCNNPKLCIITQYANFSTQFLMYYLSLKKIPWVFWAENPKVQFTENEIFATNTVRDLARKIGLLAVTKWAAEIWGIGHRACESYSNISNIPIYNIPYHVLLNRFGRKEKQSFEKLKFLYIGKLNHRKGFDILLDALTKLKEKDIYIDITVAGDGIFSGKLEREYSKEVNYIGLIEREDVANIYHNHNVLIFPTRYDGWGMALTEAMSAELITISSKNAGSSIDLIEDKKNGFTLEPLNAENLVDIITSLINRQYDLQQILQEANLSIKGNGIHSGVEKVHNRLKELLD